MSAGVRESVCRSGIRRGQAGEGQAGGSAAAALPGVS